MLVFAICFIPSWGSTGTDSGGSGSGSGSGTGTGRSIGSGCCRGSNPTGYVYISVEVTAIVAHNDPIVSIDISVFRDAQLANTVNCCVSALGWITSAHSTWLSIHIHACVVDSVAALLHSPPPAPSQHALVESDSRPSPPLSDPDTHTHTSGHDHDNIRTTVAMVMTTGTDTSNPSSSQPRHRCMDMTSSQPRY